MTKVKPQRIDANNSPQVGYVPKYVDEQTFEWWAGSSATDIGNNYLILTWTMVGTPPEVDITDTRITDTTPYLVFFETQPVGNITRTLTNGNLNIASDDNADTLDVNVLFWNIWPARQYMKGNTSLTGAWPRVITDPRITATTPAIVMPRTTPVWYVTAVTWAGTMTISSTWTEAWVIVDYIITLDTTNYSDWMPYNPTLDDDDMFFRKGISGDDEAVKWSDMKTEIETEIIPLVWGSISWTTFTASDDSTIYHASATNYAKICEYSVLRWWTYKLRINYQASWFLYPNDTVSDFDIRVNWISVQTFSNANLSGYFNIDSDITVNVWDVVSIYWRKNPSAWHPVIDFSVRFMFTLDYSQIFTLI